MNKIAIKIVENYMRKHAGYAPYLKKPLELFEELETKIIVFFDTETTGLNHVDHQLTEIGAIAVKGPEFNPVGQYYKKIELSQKTLDQIEIEKGKPKKDPKEMSIGDVLKYNRYHENPLSAEPEDIAVQGFVEFCGKFGTPILMAQNAKFDMAFIGHRAKAIGAGKIPHEKVYDTKKMAEFYFLPAIQALSNQGNVEEQIRLKLTLKDGKPSTSIKYVLKGLLIDQQGAHNSLEDVRSTITVFKKMYEYFKAYKDVVDSPEFKTEQGKAFKEYRERK